jgi:hypothetical protein
MPQVLGKYLGTDVWKRHPRTNDYRRTPMTIGLRDECQPQLLYDNVHDPASHLVVDETMASHDNCPDTVAHH